MNKISLLLLLAISFSTNAQPLLTVNDPVIVSLDSQESIIKANTKYVMAKLDAYKADYLKYKDLVVIKTQDELMKKFFSTYVMAVLDLEYGDFHEGFKIALQDKITHNVTFFDQRRNMEKFYRKIKKHTVVFKMRQSLAPYLDKELLESGKSNAGVIKGIRRWAKTDPTLFKNWQEENSPWIRSLKKHELVFDLGELDFSNLSEEKFTVLMMDLEGAKKEFSKKSLIALYHIKK